MTGCAQKVVRTLIRKRSFGNLLGTVYKKLVTPLRLLLTPFKKERVVTTGSRLLSGINRKSAGLGKWPSENKSSW